MGGDPKGHELPVGPGEDPRALSDRIGLCWHFQRSQDAFSCRIIILGYF